MKRLNLAPTYSYITNNVKKVNLYALLKFIPENIPI